MTYPFHISDDVAGMRKAIENHLKCTLARDARTATRQDWYLATAHAVRDRIMERYIVTMQTHANANTRRVYYLSLEYLMGRMLHNNLYNTGLFETARKALAELGLAMPEIDEEEPDMGLGNGGLGRLAACFLDSLATLDLPAVGYGIFYEFGLFRQRFVNGHQTEYPDSWLQVPSPWFVMRPEYAIEVKLYGHVEHTVDDRGDFTIRWVGTRTVLGIPHDLPICGYGARTVNFLRLWESRASEEFDLTIFNEGGYVEAVREKAVGETFTKVLYPNDKSESGKELRLVQQYFIVACSLRDIVRRYFRENEGWDQFADKVAIQLNDTHPAVAVAELMRLMIDVYGLEFDEAWSITQRTVGYTNHTLLPEALESWPLPLFERLLPRHMQIVYAINSRVLREAR
ncbi:MAG TPA: glycogen/starch/alpha-glucan phosphorylase, partial [Polyangiaceae bacterium]|nr:glycogen/starch/alpha-glucan phosphorylase [Polyangiaceae bacterium]